MKVLIKNNENELQLMEEEEFEQMVLDCEEFDGIHPYIFLGYLYEEKQ